MREYKVTIKNSYINVVTQKVVVLDQASRSFNIAAPDGHHGFRTEISTQKLFCVAHINGQEEQIPEYFKFREARPGQELTLLRNSRSNAILYVLNHNTKKINEYTPAITIEYGLAKYIDISTTFWKCLGILSLGVVLIFIVNNYYESNLNSIAKISIFSIIGLLSLIGVFKIINADKNKRNDFASCEIELFRQIETICNKEINL